MWVTAALGVALAAAPSPEAVAVLSKHECNRCHSVEGVEAPATLELSCANCHRDISMSPLDLPRFERGEQKFGKAWARFVSRTSQHYNHLPALRSMGRFKASWLRSFLTAPHDIRPGLSESMFRPALTPAELETLISGWGAQQDMAPVPPVAAAAGKQLFEQKQCATCHLFGAAYPAPKLTARAQLLAPDLQHVAARMTRPMLIAYLGDPIAVMPSSEMPNFGLTDKETNALADFLLGPRPKTLPVKVVKPAVPKSTVVPAYEEVEAKVFRAVCWHCHSNPDFADGNGGPGMSGGFGFAPRKLSFATYEELLAGTVDANGKRRSVFSDGPSGEPLLIEVLRARYVENARDHVVPGANGSAGPLPKAGAPRGMPMGLPALTDEQFSLVLRWVKGGHPGPTGEAPSDGVVGPMGQ